MKVAIVGSGVSGLAATWLLNEHSDHEAHLFEADERPGGHANTVSFRRPDRADAQPVSVDRGFIVFNIPTYPNFSRFLHLCDISWRETEMTFSVSRDRGAFEWAGKNPFTIFCQPSNLFRLDMWRMIWDILRFNSRASWLVQITPGSAEDEIGNQSLGEFLRSGGYSEAFINDYILPMTACIWSTPPNICALDFPARAQLRFMYNHHLLQIIGKPPWLTITGGSKVYVDEIVSKLPPQQLHLSTPVLSVSSTAHSKVLLTTGSGEQLEFDHVIMACHSDTTMQVLEKGESGTTEIERKVLGAFGWAKNEVVLHNDLELMPVRKVAWSCWNFLTSSTHALNGDKKHNSDSVSLTYDMNQLQHISEKEHGKVLVTLNPPYGPKPETIVSRQPFSHPMFTAETPWAQTNLHRIQNVRGITYAGAWTKYGFHEDGFTSGMLVACKYLGVKPPFIIKSPDRPSTSRHTYLAEMIERVELWRLWALAVMWRLVEVVLGKYSAITQKARVD